MSNYFVDFIDLVSGSTLKSRGPYYSERQAETAERGVNRNLNHASYYTQIREENN